VPFVSLTDTVQNGADGDIVYLCAPSPAACDSTTNLQAITLTGGSNSFTFTNLDAGSYRARAFRSTNKDDFATFTVAANTGVISPTALNLRL